MKPAHLKWLGILCSAIILAPPTTYAASDMFLDLDEIRGESTDKVYRDKIDVLSWSWAMSNSGNTHIVGGAGAGRVNVQDLSLTKYVDKASPLIMLKCANGGHIDRATLVVRRAGDKPLEFIRITMTEVIVSSVSTGGSGSEERLTEKITLNFAKVKVEYVPTKPDGTAGIPVSFGWNIAANTPE